VIVSLLFSFAVECSALFVSALGSIPPFVVIVAHSIIYRIKLLSRFFEVVADSSCCITNNYRNIFRGNTLPTITTLPTHNYQVFQTLLDLTSRGNTNSQVRRALSLYYIYYIHTYIHQKQLPEYNTYYKVSSAQIHLHLHLSSFKYQGYSSRAESRRQQLSCGLS